MIIEQKVRLVMEEGIGYGETPNITNADAAAAIGRAYINANFPDREMCIALILDTKNRITGVYTVSVGSLNVSIVHPREVFKAAILGNAAAIVLIHNHPSGDPAPSREDFNLTERMKKAGDLLGIRFLDHVIIGHNSHYGMADKGHL